MMKRSLQLGISQQLTLTPQFQQSLRLLQMPTVDLLQDVEQWLRDNPLLERDGGEAGEGGGEETASDEHTDHSASAGEEGLPQWSGNGAHGDDDFDDQNQFSEALTLKDHLYKQLSLSQISDLERVLVTLLIDNLDEDGYLSQPLEEMVAWLPESLESGEQELRIALRLLQNFDPPGIGARNLRECLLLQLDNMSEPLPGVAYARQVVDLHLPLLAAKDFSQMLRLLGCTKAELRQAHDLILRLVPRPGSRFTHESPSYIIPDVIVCKQGAHWNVRLNPAATPALRLHGSYSQILRQMPKAERPADLANQLQEARWLIRSMRQRCDTILHVSQVIVERQQAFLDFGPLAMRPLILRDVAESLGLHESTISRVTNQKYMATPRGVFELKSFFGSAVSTEIGGSRSSTAIRAQIETLLKNETGHTPMSDTDIVDALRAEGIQIARRTVAKYRGMMNIPPAHLRKTLNPDTQKENP